MGISNESSEPKKHDILLWSGILTHNHMEHSEGLEISSGSSAAAKGRHDESEFVYHAKAESEEAEREKSRKKIADLEEEIAHLTASIEKIVASIREGQRIVKKSGSAAAAAIKESLEKGAAAEKIRLIEEKEKLENERRQLEEELMGL